jgi:nitroreductase|tara:strand:- start:5462 stop:5986 length:525 start_codon:yes stop_codon:yes gene_type:complete
MMEVFDAVQTRLTVRQFKSDPVPDDVVMKLLRAGQWAPSSRNLQPWHFIVVRDRDMLRQIGGIATSGSFVSEAPMAIAIAMDNADRSELDAGRALQQMELVAWDEGLGTCFVGLRVEEQNRKIKELLGIPEGMDLITVLPFGYRDDNVRGTRRRREALSGMAHSERFGEAYPEG